MRIMIFDVPAESGGALSVLQDFYDKYKTDQKNEYIFVVGKAELQEIKNIKVLRFPWIKKSWLHRLYFDNFIAPKLVNKYKVDEVLSLQNIIIPHTHINQSVYVHNAIPFVDYKFSFFDTKLLWIYQNILSRSIFKSIRNADKVIVQTEWMKKRCINKLGVEGHKIEVLPPKLNIEVKRLFVQPSNNFANFFYPASGVIFKNHKIIIDACLKLKKEGIINYKIIFTLKGNENRYISKLFKDVVDNELPIEFIGPINRNEVFENYSKAILIFPSFIETVGLPLLEAMSHDTPILASACDFSKEVLKNYGKVMYFDPFNADELRNLIVMHISTMKIN